MEMVDRSRYRLDDAHDVRELELDEADAIRLRAFDLFDAAHRLVGCYHRCASSMVVPAARPCTAWKPSGGQRSSEVVPHAGDSSRRVRSELGVLHQSDSERERQSQVRIRQAPAGQALDPMEAIRDGVA